MFNPLISDLSNLSSEELSEKILTLHERAIYMSYHRPFDPMHLQIQNVLRVYSDELSRRNSKNPVDTNK